LFTDVAPALAVGQFVDAPVLLVLGAGDGGQAGELVGLQRLTAGQNCLAVPAGTSSKDLSVALAELSEFDCSEPFGRIREAIEEAQRGTGTKAA
jgi:hypothetical protein